jgi:hypothetical protein
MKNIASITLGVCGNEEIAPDGQAHTINAGAMGTNQYKKVGSALFDKWFTLTIDQSGQYEQCGIDTYKLYDKDENEITADTANPLAQLTKDYNEFVQQDLLIRLDPAAGVLPGNVFYVEAITKGKKTARTKLDINVDLTSDDEDVGECRFTVTPF